MGSRIKKLFGRKSQDLHDSEQLDYQQRQAQVGGSNPAFRHSLYETTTSAGAPQLGELPIKGDGIPGVGRRSSSAQHRGGHGRVSESSMARPYSPQQETSPPYAALDFAQGNRQSSNTSSAAYNGPGGGHVGTSENHASGLSNDESLAQPFSGMSLNEPNGQSSVYTNNLLEASQVARQRDGLQTNGRDAGTDRDTGGNVKPPIPTYPMDDPRTYNMPSGSVSGPAGRDGANMTYDDRRPTQHAPHQPHSSSIPSRSSLQADESLARKTSIPRKQVGSSSVPSNSAAASAATYEVSERSPRDGDSQQLQSTRPRGARDPGYKSSKDTSSPRQYDTTPNFSRVSNNLRGGPSAQEVVERARTNTKDTTVTEVVAPAVVHETVNRDVHHVRQEVITREIHNHDVFHRIQPVIDVEVLPPRHFLPVEGGGLVEVSASEVPGRGKNWVIAETSSKIPSGVASPHTTSRFSAREFIGDEGDTKRYMTAEGYERTEQTWIHPPELETGARDSGQTWPMEFGKPHKKHRSSGAHGKTKSTSKTEYNRI